MVYNAVFITYLLLSNFDRIGEKERLAVELIVDLAASFDLDLGRINMTRDIYGKARILLPQLYAIASRYGQVHHDPEITFNGAHSLLLAIIRPLVAHLCPYEHREVKSTLSDAQQLLDLPLIQLQAFVHKWYSQNFEIVLQTTPLPRSNAGPCKPESQPPTCSKTELFNRVVRKYDPRAKRYGWSPPTRMENPKAATVGATAGRGKPGWSSRPALAFAGMRGTKVSKEELARREWPQSPTDSSSSGSGPDTPDMPSPPDHWAGSLRSCWDESLDSIKDRDIYGSVAVGQKLRKGIRAMFSSSSQAI